MRFDDPTRQYLGARIRAAYVLVMAAQFKPMPAGPTWASAALRLYVPAQKYLTNSKP